jgi:hypothetical protein
MNPDPPTPPNHRRTWLALLAGGIALVVIFFLFVVVEPMLVTLAMESVTAEPRANANGWANGSIWLISTGFCCLALLTVGYTAKRLSPARSWLAPITLLVLVVVYVFFAQFPATQSHWRIALWAIALPASLAVGAWLASRSRHAH